ncbi:nitrate- and nitrite sensing domain-containing protein [Solwaraspora sp. WMMB335]|uniref:sensor histidine kinase n=1 Tax=Solwaraspora sp. WMMB335 TaxID=3404118 RepID=UPI003B924A75
MRNWPIRPQVILVLVLPLLALTGTGFWVVADQLAQARSSEQTRDTATWLVSVNELIHALQEERYAVSSLVGSGYRVTSFADQATAAATKVDDAFAQVTASTRALPDESRDRVTDAVTAARGHMSGLADLRASVAERSLQPGPGTVAYSNMIHSWLDAGASLTGVGSEDTDLIRIASALSAISWTSEQASQQYGYLSAAVNLGDVIPGSETRVQAAIGAEQAWIKQFRSTALPDQIEFFDQTVGSAAERVAGLRDRVLNGQAESVSFPEWAEASLAKEDALRVVEARIVADLEQNAARLASAANQRALLSALLIAGTLAVSLVVSAVVAAGLVRAMRELRAGALRVAEKRLPEVTAKLRAGNVVDPGGEPPVFDRPPRNEIGDVAQACNTLYGAAITATYEMATVRSTGDVMRTLARRSLSLTRRQLRLITEAEREEEDPKMVEMLFGIDHQATRMRRLAESLLVLSGEQPHRSSREAAALRDVLRAATAEVEDYTRIRIAPDGGEVRIVGSAVGDLTHLLAELLENAIAFSPAGAPVEVRTGQVGHGWAIDIEDRGAGLDDATLAQINGRLAEPPPFEPERGGQIGLVVVARLAARHKIMVQMRRGLYFGVHVVIILPSGVLHGLDAAPHPVAAQPSQRSRGGDRSDVRRHRRGRRAEPMGSPAGATFEAPRTVRQSVLEMDPQETMAELPKTDPAWVDDRTPVNAPDGFVPPVVPDPYPPGPVVSGTGTRAPESAPPAAGQLPLLPHRIRGAHLADQLRTAPETLTGAANPPTPATRDPATSAEDARRLAAGFMNGYTRGLNASSNENGR